MREYFNCPIIIGSGYRSPALNEAVGGVSNNPHMTGEAADINLNSIEKGKCWLTWITNNCTFDQLIWEKSTPSSTHHWILVSYKQSGTLRQHVIQNLVKNP